MLPLRHSPHERALQLPHEMMTFSHEPMHEPTPLQVEVADEFAAAQRWSQDQSSFEYAVIVADKLNELHLRPRTPKRQTDVTRQLRRGTDREHWLKIKADPGRLAARNEKRRAAYRRRKERTQ